jgi:hypothetical protein
MKYSNLVFPILWIGSSILLVSCTKERSPSNTFPFNKSHTIELVSYETRIHNYLNDQLIEAGAFVVPGIKQRIILSKEETNKLFDILYDSDQIGGHSVQSLADCYSPRHSIVFYDSGRAIAFLEVCFECEGTRQTPNVDFGKFTEEKWCTLQKFFKANKADFAIIDEMCPK